MQGSFDRTAIKRCFFSAVSNSCITQFIFTLFYAREFDTVEFFTVVQSCTAIYKVRL